MYNRIKERVIKTAKLIIDHKYTVRDAAKVLGVSKSTVHKDMAERLPKINPSLAVKVSSIFAHHTDVRHLRGGEATKMKYRKARNE